MRLKLRIAIIMAGLILTMLFAGCTAPKVTETATPTPRVTIAPAVTAVVTPTPTVEVTPTATPEPTETPATQATTTPQAT